MGEWAWGSVRGGGTNEEDETRWWSSARRYAECRHHLMEGTNTGLGSSGRGDREMGVEEAEMMRVGRDIATGGGG